MTDHPAAVAMLDEWREATVPFKKFPVVLRVAEGLGMAHLSRTGAGVPTLALCYIQAERQREGLGTKLLEKITGLADKHGVFLEVVPHTDKPYLVAWYERHGFTEQTLDGIGLLRIPNLKSTAEQFSELHDAILHFKHAVIEGMATMFKPRPSPPYLSKPVPTGRYYREDGSIKTVPVPTGCSECGAPTKRRWFGLGQIIGCTNDECANYWR